MTDELFVILVIAIPVMLLFALNLRTRKNCR